jgi:hypothetical protein
LMSASWDRLLEIDGKPLPIVATRKRADGGSEGEPELVPIPVGNAAAGGGDATGVSGAAEQPTKLSAAATEPATTATEPTPARPAGPSSGNSPSAPPPPERPATFRLMLLGLGGFGLLLTLIRVARSRKAGSRCRGR